MDHKYDENGFIVLEEVKDSMVASVLRMKAGSSSFRKQFGEDTQRKTVHVAEAYESVKTVKKDKTKFLEVIGGIAATVVPVIAKNLLGVNVSISKGFGFNMDVFFK